MVPRLSLPCPRSGRQSAALGPWVTALLALATLATLVYWNSLQNGFVLDDVPIVQTNRLLRDRAPLLDHFVTQYWPSLQRAGAVYRPVTMLSFALDWRWWGGTPVGFHAVNMALHTCAVLALVLLLVRVGVRRTYAWLGAALFAVHPVHVEAVSNIVGRAEVLVTVFVLLAGLLYLSAAPRLLRTLGVAVLYFVALGAKESAVSLPGVLLILAALDLRLDATNERVAGGPARRPWRELGGRLLADVPLWLALGAALAGYLWLRWIVLGSVHGSILAPSLDTLPTADRLATAVTLWPQYLRLLFWPQQLSADYSPNAIPVTSWRDSWVWASLALGALAVGAAHLAGRRGVVWGWVMVAWGVVTLAVVSNIPFPVGILLAERNLYLPSVLVAFLPVAVAETWQGRLAWSPGPVARGAGAGLAILALVLAAGRTWTRTPVWRDGDSYVRSVIRDVPTSYRALYYQASRLAGQGHYEAALPLFARATATVPDDALVHMLYANTLRKVGRLADAEREAWAGFAPTQSGSFIILLDVLIAREAYARARPVVELGLSRFGGSRTLNKQAVHIYEALGMAPQAAAARGRVADPAAFQRLDSTLRALERGDAAVAARITRPAVVDSTVEAVLRLSAPLDSVAAPPAP